MMVVTSILLLGVLDSQIAQWSALRNTQDYEEALYVAGAGAHHALSELEQDPAWNAGIPDTTFPVWTANSYSVTVARPDANTVVLTATGRVGTVERRLEVTVDPGS